MIISAGCKDYIKHKTYPGFTYKYFFIYIYVGAVYGDKKQPLKGMEFI